MYIFYMEQVFCPCWRLSGKFYLEGWQCFPFYWFRKMSPRASKGLRSWHDFLQSFRCSPGTTTQAGEIASQCLHWMEEEDGRQHRQRDEKRNWGKTEETWWSPCEHAVLLALQMLKNKVSSSLVKNLYYLQRGLIFHWSYMWLGTWQGRTHFYFRNRFLQSLASEHDKWQHFVSLTLFRLFLRSKLLFNYQVALL